MEYTIRRTAMERPYEALSELRLLPNKNGGQNKRVAKKPLSPLHLPLRQKRNKTKPTQRHMEKTHTIFTHKAENKGKDITQELQQIQQKYSEITQAG